MTTIAQEHYCNYCTLAKGQQRCSSCKSVYYCDKDCQRSDWLTCQEDNVPAISLTIYQKYALTIIPRDGALYHFIPKTILYIVKNNNYCPLIEYINENIATINSHSHCDNIEKSLKTLGYWNCEIFVKKGSILYCIAPVFEDTK